MPPFRGANFLSQSPPVDRPSWRLTPGKSLCHRFEAPTFCPRARRPSARVSASSPVKPYATVPRRQHFAPEPSGRAPELAPHSRQSLEPPFRGANFLPRSPPAVRPSWRLTPGKVLCHRFEAPTFCPGARLPSARVGASPRQSLMPPFRGANFLSQSPPVDRPSWRLTPRQILVPPFRGANILPQSLPVGRPSWRLTLRQSLELPS